MSRAALDRRSSLLLMGGGLLGAVIPAGNGRAAEPAIIVVTTGMIGDIVSHTAGERATIVQLMGDGVDPHLYKATRSDISRMLNADLVFYNGLLLEGKMTDALIRVANAGRPVIAVTERLPEETLLAPPEQAGHFDPHVWMDPSAWSIASEVVEEQLRERLPDLAIEFAERGAAYRAELARLDAYAREVVGTVPAERRLLVTAHDAFGYFGRRYGFEVLGIQGISTESEAGLEQIEQLVDLLVTRNIPAVFAETTVPDRGVQALIRGAAARGHTMRKGGSLFSDAMGPPGTYEGSYVGMIDHNVTVIASALGGAVPERGLNGRLTMAGLSPPRP